MFKIIIWPSRLSERYVTSNKQKAILSKVNDLVQTDQWFDALSEVIGKLIDKLHPMEIQYCRSKMCMVDFWMFKITVQCWNSVQAICTMFENVLIRSYFC